MAPQEKYLSGEHDVRCQACLRVSLCYDWIIFLLFVDTKLCYAAFHKIKVILVLRVSISWGFIQKLYFHATILYIIPRYKLLINAIYIKFI